MSRADLVGVTKKRVRVLVLNPVSCWKCIYVVETEERTQ